MIIVEGPDGAGKSTLCRDLARELGLQIHRKEPPDGPKNTRENTYAALGRAVSGGTPVEIHDRLYFSELVYGRVLRDRIEFDYKEQRFIEKVLWAIDCPIIICLPPLTEVLDNVADKNVTQYKGVVEHTEAIYTRYYKIWDAMSRRAYNRLLLWDYTSPDEVDGKAIIQEYIEQRRFRTW